MKKGITDWMLNPKVTKHPIATVHLGPKPTFIINDLKLAKELFDREEVSARTASEAQIRHRFFNQKPQGIIWTSGTQWSTQRRFSLKTLKDFGFGKDRIEDSIHFEADLLIDKFLSSPGEDFLLSSDFNVPIINILWQMVTGCRFTADDPRGMKMLDQVTVIFTQGAKVDTMPYWLNRLFPRITGLEERSKAQEGILKYLLSVAQEQQEEREEESEARHFIDVYLAEMEKNPKDFSFEELCSIIFDFFSAGTETSSTTMKWAVLFLSINQDVQERCRREVMEVLGDEKAAVADMPKMPYVLATIAEIQRIARVAPSSIPHTSTATTTINLPNSVSMSSNSSSNSSGSSNTNSSTTLYTFPPGSTFMANISFIMNDPKHFVEPDKFNPERFINEEGRYIKSERVIPFSIGKRYCMGELLARNEVFIFFVSLLQRVRMVPPLHQELPSPDNYISNLTRIPDDFYLRMMRT